jgi:hypothetical protein
MKKAQFDRPVTAFECHADNPVDKRWYIGGKRVNKSREIVIDGKPAEMYTSTNGVNHVQFKLL